MTDTTLSPASPSIDIHGRATSPVHKLRSAELARVWNERVDKIKKMRDEYETLRQRRLRQLLDAERAAQDLRDKLVEQRKQKREEAKRREDERRSAAEERRRQHEAEEKSKLEESIRRSTERESRFDSLKRRAGVGHSEKYAFGSSLPRDFGSLFGSASASASRAESDYEDNGGSLKTSRSASPRRDPSKKERRAQSAGTNGRRVYETLPLSLAPDNDSPLFLSAGGRTKPLKGSSVMSTSMLVEYHSALMPVASSLAESALVTSSRGTLGELSASSSCRRARSHNASSTSASPRRVTHLDSSVSPLRSRAQASRASPVRTVNRCDEQLFISLPAAKKSDDRPARSLARLTHTSNGETALSDAGGFERHSSPRASRLRKPQVGRSGSPCKAAPSVTIPPRSSSRSQKQPTSPSRIPVSTRAKLERSHSAGAADSRQSLKAAPRNVLSGASGIPKSVRPRSADPERRNRLPVDDANKETTKPPATVNAPGATSASSYAEWKAKMASASPSSAMKDCILTPKRAASPSKLPHSLRPKTPTPNTGSEQQQPAVVVRGRTKSPIKVSMTGSSLPQGVATQSTATVGVGGSAAAIISIIKTPPVTQPSITSQLPPDANVPPVQSMPVAVTEPAPTPTPTPATREPPPSADKPALADSVKRETETGPTAALPVPVPAPALAPTSTSSVTSSTTAGTDPAPSEAAPNGPLPSDANAGGWSQLEQALLAKRSEQLEEEWQKLKSDEERKQRELTDRERALKAREAQLAELEKERLARKERLKNIMTRVRPGAEEEVPPVDANRAQSMCTLTDLRSQQLGLFGGASEVEFAGAWAPSRRVMFAQAPLVLGGAPQQPTAPLTIPRTAHNSAALNSILRTSRQSGTLQPGTAELSSSAPPAVGGLAAFGGISSLMQLRRQVEAAAASAVRAGQNAQPSGPSAAGSST